MPRAAVTAATAAMLLLAPASAGAKTLFSDSFRGPDRLLTNEYATYSTASASAAPHARTVADRGWTVTSGSLFVRRGWAWTGMPDGSRPDQCSCEANDSAVFRALTRRANLRNVVVSFRLVDQRLVRT